MQIGAVGALSYSSALPVRREAPPRPDSPSKTTATKSIELTPDELRLIQQLRQRDREVRAHELAHQTTGGPYAGSARFGYARGPDGQLYAVEGEVELRAPLSPDPEEALRHAETLLRAALAPAQPSAQDLRVAADAAAKQAQASAEVARLTDQNKDPAAVARPVEGEVIEAGEPVEADDDLPRPAAVEAFLAVRDLAAGELLAQGGRLDIYA